MKIRITQLSIFLAATITMVSQAPSFAGEVGRGARFDFAPNYWKNEKSKMPEDNNDEPKHNVHSGSMPKGSNFLGLDPTILAKPKAEPVMQVSSKPINAPSIKEKTPFNPAFGAPQIANLPNAGTLPSLPKAAMLPKAAAIAPKSIQAKRPLHYSNSLAGRLLTKTKPHALKAMPEVANYGKNFGYVPGTFVPVSSYDGMSTHTEVRGQVLSKRR